MLQNGLSKLHGALRYSLGVTATELKTNINPKLTNRKDYLHSKVKEVIMIRTINILDMFLKPCFVLIEIIVPQRCRMSCKQASICSLVFLLQLFKTGR